MNFEETDPLTSRSRFTSRRGDNIIRLLTWFIPFVFLGSWVASILFSGILARLSVDAIAIVGAYYFYTLWDKRTILLRCGNCEEIILSNTPWVCGVCKQPNRNATENPFVHRCGHKECGAEPKAYKCHHCGLLIFLTNDEDNLSYAYCLNSPDEVPKPDERAEKLKKHQESKEDKIGKLELLKLAEELRIIRKRLRVERPKTAEERLRHGVSARMELEEAADKVKATLAKTYKGQKLRRWKLAVDDCLRDELAKQAKEE